MKREYFAALAPFAPLTAHDPFPAQLRKEFVYSDLIQIAAGATAFTTGTERIFRLNSLFAPDVSGGHQPYGFNQMELMYRRYVVTDALIEIQSCPINDSADSDRNWWMVAMIVPAGFVNTTTGKTFSALGEMPGCEIRPVIANALPVTIRQKLSIAAIEGVPPTRIRGDETFQALMTSSPSRVPSLILNVFNATTSIATCSIMLKITFTAHLHERIVFSQSS